MLVVNTAPCKFRPKPDSDIRCNHVFHGRRVVALENDLRREPRMLAEPVADITELSGTKETDKSIVCRFFKPHRFPSLVFPIFRHRKIDFLTACKAVLFLLPLIEQLRGHGNIIKLALRILLELEIDLFMFFLIFDDCLHHKPRRCQHVHMDGLPLQRYHHFQLFRYGVHLFHQRL